MANFFDILKKIGSVVEKAEPVASFALRLTPFGSFAPLLDTATNLIHGGVISAEATVKGAGQGAVKAEDASAFVDNGLSFAQEILNLHGENLTDDPQLRAAAIKAQADAFNAIAKWKQSFKIEKKG
jgi:hypothetical protein